ncbi:MAG TPA: Spy/CpxP family protein refolding chaperone [Syntrophobacteria bacterium]|nr:Spy/CpxP family protein refolding chaperone [Syntrophobacteria bacterium]
MSRKTMITLGGIAASVLLVASLALAQGHMGGGDWGRGPGMMGYWHASNLTPEQVAQMTKLRSEFYNETAALRGQLAAKHAELQALMTNPDATSAQISAKEREILQLRTQFGEKRIANQAKMRNLLTKEQLTELATSGGCGFPRGGGYHHGMGMGMGPGPGPGPGFHHGMEAEPGPAPQTP